MRNDAPGKKQAAQNMQEGVENRQGIDQYLIMGWKFRDHSLGMFPRTGN